MSTALLAPTGVPAFPGGADVLPASLPGLRAWQAVAYAGMPGGPGRPTPLVYRPAAARSPGLLTRLRALR